MLPDRRVPTHPGVILATEFLGPLGMTQVQLAKKLGIPVQRINELIRGKRGVTAETAWLLGGEFRTGPEFWMNLQALYDIEEAARRHSKEVRAIHPHRDTITATAEK